MIDKNTKLNVTPALPQVLPANQTLRSNTASRSDFWEMYDACYPCLSVKSSAFTPSRPNTSNVHDPSILDTTHRPKSSF